MNVSRIINNNINLSPYRFNLSFKSSENPIKPKLKELSCDVFTKINTKKEKEDEIFNDIISGGGKFDIDFYHSLSDKCKKIMLKNCEKSRDIKCAADINLKVASILKNYLDDTYGKDNYVFVSIGTSPACIARVFEFSGVETKYLPASNLRWVKDSDIEEEKSANKNAKYKQFLEEQNLTKEDIEKSGKNYLFYDYTLTGKSLSRFKKIMEDLYGLKSDKIQFRSLNSDLTSFAINNEKIAPLITQYIQIFFLYAEACHYGGIAHLSFKDFNEINSCKKYYDPLSKCYNFLVMYNLDKQNTLKSNPSNNSSL